MSGLSLSFATSIYNLYNYEEEIKMKRKNLFAVIALICVFAMVLAGCGSQKTAETTVPVETTAAETTTPQPLGLSNWAMTANTWSSPNGATINLTATPSYYAEGQSAAFVVRLEGEESANVPCDWNGTQYTASAELNAADGYCYYVVLTAADGSSTEVAVNTPTVITDESFINMATSLNSYCSIVVEESSFENGKLTITSGNVQVQAPKITNQGETITCKEVKLVLTFGSEELDSEKLTLEASDTAAAYEAALKKVTFDVPDMEDDQQLNLRLDVTLSNGQFLTAPGGTWYYNDSNLLPAVG